MTWVSLSNDNDEVENTLARGDKSISVLQKSCNTAHMEQMKTRHELLEDLVAQGVLSRETSQSIELAPKWSVSIRELISYLASIIIAVGVVRILAIAFEDASEGAISAALYVVSVGTGIASWKLSAGSTIRQRFAEVLELGSLGSFVGATAIVLNQVDELKSPWIGVILSAIATLWGVYRCWNTNFAGTAAVVIGIPALGGSIGAVTDSDATWAMSAFTLIPGIVLLFLGTRAIGAPLLARAGGALFYVIGTMPLGADLSYGKFIPIVLGAVLFGVGSLFLAPEMLIAGAFLIVAGIVMSVVRWVNNDLAQGLVIIATGLAMLGVLSVQMKRAVSRPKTGTPTV